MKNQLPKRNIFEGLNLMFYSNTNALAGDNVWLGTGGYTGSYSLPGDSYKERVVKMIKPTVIFSLYKLFTSPMPGA